MVEDDEDIDWESLRNIDWERDEDFEQPVPTPSAAVMHKPSREKQSAREKQERPKAQADPLQHGTTKQALLTQKYLAVLGGSCANFWPVKFRGLRGVTVWFWGGPALTFGL